MRPLVSRDPQLRRPRQRFDSNDRPARRAASCDDRTRISTLTYPSYRVLAISGSLRARSTNTEALRAAAFVAPASLRVEMYPGLASLPHFNPDLDVEGAVA